MTIAKQTGFWTIVQINIRFMFSAGFLAYGWTLWQWTSPEWWGLGIAAFLALLGGSMGFVGTLYQVIVLIARDRKLHQFAKQGGTARADRLASERDLKKQGITR